MLPPSRVKGEDEKLVQAMKRL